MKVGPAARALLLGLKTELGASSFPIMLTPIMTSGLSAGNGYIEGKELENFIKELETARRGTGASMVSIRG